MKEQIRKDHSIGHYKLIGTIVITVITLTMISCAQLGIPTGGPKDTQEPVLIEANSSPNYQTYFNDKKIVFEFDEWIVIQNPIEEVVVSPPLSYPFKFEVKGKRTIFTFSEEEVLKPDATYQINFGDAIRDFTVGNVLKNFIFVFSTGDKIDSLSISGSVVDAYDNKPREGVLVMLYDDLSDTVVTTSKPFYFTKTDDQGAFSLKNLREDTFRIYALKDENVNYIYDLPTEQIGFLDSLIILKDTITKVIDLEIFDEVDEPQLLSTKQAKKGLIKALYNRLPDDYVVNDINGNEITATTSGDTVLIWHTELDNDSTFYLIKYDDRQDTIFNKRARDSMSDGNLSFAKTQNKNISIYRDDSIRLEFTHYLKASDSLKLSLSDSSAVYDLIDYTYEARSLILRYDSLEVDSTYDLTLYPDLVEDIYGLRIKDTTTFTVTVKDPGELGNLNINVTNVDTTSYAIHVIKAETVIKKMTIKTDTSFQLNRLESGMYSLRVIEDVVQDNMWTPGDVILKRQSERLVEVPLEELRAGWDIEFTLDINQVFDGIKSQ